MNMLWHLVFALIMAAGLWLSGLAASVARAEPGVEAVQTGVTLKVIYLEPDTTLGGLPLDDLAYTTIRILDGAVVIDTRQVQAIEATGGKRIEEDFAVSAPRGQVKNLTVETDATDLNSNVSDIESAMILIDRDPPGRTRKAN